jgi:hypothetical protein
LHGLPYKTDLVAPVVFLSARPAQRTPFMLYPLQQERLPSRFIATAMY